MFFEWVDSVDSQIDAPLLLAASKSLRWTFDNFNFTQLAMHLLSSSLRFLTYSLTLVSPLTLWSVTYLSDPLNSSSATGFVILREEEN